MDALPRRTLLTSAAALATFGSIGLTARPALAARAEVPLPDGIQPEGITSGPGAVFFVGSLNDGRIVTGDLLRGTTRVLLPGATGRQLRGLLYDDRTGIVHAVGNVGDVAHVWAVGSASGRIIQDTVVPGGKFLNDLVILGDALWVTDSLVDRLTKIPLTSTGRPTGGAPEFLELTGQWPAGDGKANNANGIRTLPGGTLLLDNSRVGGLWQVNPSTGRGREIPVAGSPAIVGGDGVERRGTTAYVVRGSDNYSVTAVELSRDGTGWTGTVSEVLRDDRLDVPSTATFAAGALYAVNARFGTASPATARYWVTRLPL
ncbi:hypothetical protein [Lapillicoccus jejuensis]|uniref:Sugar lactone lactonase YvrE n=1 Tax=Lapillicoccus jejuensis TaxID=402171 RepID=A0A542E321_9MICO|nr:hypothetical protein [Lapillicoccus jejuensis]TQJ09722.1 hypothetical protein FB458_2836 [Lapillicoccus jejuensis]